MKFKRIRNIKEALEREIDKLGEQELTNLIAECRNLSPTNCSWSVYGLRVIVAEIAKSQRRWLKIQKVLAKKKTK